MTEDPSRLAHKVLSGDGSRLPDSDWKTELPAIVLFSCSLSLTYYVPRSWHSLEVVYVRIMRDTLDIASRRSDEQIQTRRQLHLKTMKIVARRSGPGISTLNLRYQNMQHSLESRVYSLPHFRSNEKYAEQRVRLIFCISCHQEPNPSYTPTYRVEELANIQRCIAPAG